MPLTPPNLDIRKFDDLKREALLRIPRYNPEWTDFNESDPGVTLLELFAWLTEMMFYRLNQVPELNYIKFLQLLGMELRPAQPAVAHVTFTAKAGATAVGPVPAGTQLTAQSADGKSLIFETQSELALIALDMTDVQVYDGSSFTVVSQANQVPGPAIQPFGFQPQLESALYLGFAPPKNVPAGVTLPAFPLEMTFRVFLPPDPTAGAAQNADLLGIPPAPPPPPPPVTLVWEYRSRINPAKWKALKVYRDESARFMREGYIQVEGPQDAVPTLEGKLQDPKSDPRYWIRVRVDQSNWGAGVTPQIDFIRPNTVDAQNVSTVADEDVGQSDGTPRQTFTLQNKPVLPDSLTLTVTNNPNDPNPNDPDAQPVKWQQVEDFLASQNSDLHYVLNLSTGQIQFGDGTHGEIPVAGAQITAAQYRYGGGVAGNVDKGAISSIRGGVPGVDKVNNDRPAVGGADEQTLDELKQYAPRELRARNRAVTAEDFAVLAAQAGGVAKATALALASPEHPGVMVAGAVTVVIVPTSQDMPPTPSSDLIRSVCAYLNQFRLLTTELWVRGPRYHAVRVEAQVLADPAQAPDQVSIEIANALDAFLDPVAGKLGFGKPLYPTQLYAVMIDAGAAAVTGMQVYIDEVPVQDPGTASKIDPGDLFYGSGHKITVAPAGGQ